MFMKRKVTCRNKDNKKEKKGRHLYKRRTAGRSAHKTF